PAAVATSRLAPQLRTPVQAAWGCVGLRVLRRWHATASERHIERHSPYCLAPSWATVSTTSSATASKVTKTGRHAFLCLRLRQEPTLLVVEVKRLPLYIRHSPLPAPKPWQHCRLDSFGSFTRVLDLRRLYLLSDHLLAYAGRLYHSSLLAARIGHVVHCRAHSGPRQDVHAATSPPHPAVYKLGCNGKAFPGLNGHRFVQRNTNELGQLDGDMSSLCPTFGGGSRPRHRRKLLP
ncbi:hypothetical protein HaLaN_05301, partial [Haematococcus lacustris]